MSDSPAHRRHRLEGKDIDVDVMAAITSEVGKTTAEVHETFPLTEWEGVDSLGRSVAGAVIGLCTDLDSSELRNNPLTVLAWAVLSVGDRDLIPDSPNDLMRQAAQMLVAAEYPGPGGEPADEPTGETPVSN